MNTHCDYCLEISNSKTSLFYKIYSKIIKKRIIYENDDFICVPTIGQIIQGSLLIIPKHHYNTLSSMKENEVDSFLDIYKEMSNLYNKTAMYEHGCYPKEGHNCGVYHAHAHLIPIKTSFQIEELLGVSYRSVGGIKETLQTLKNSKEYILFIDADWKTYCVLPSSSNKVKFKSQYFRKWLVKKYNIEKNYDWRTYHTPEKELLETYTSYNLVKNGY